MLCHCGCGTETKNTFSPGHDQRLRTQLEKRTGNLIGLERLVTACEAYASGASSRETLEAEIRDIFERRGEPTC